MPYSGKRSRRLRFAARSLRIFSIWDTTSILIRESTLYRRLNRMRARLARSLCAAAAEHSLDHVSSTLSSQALPVPKRRTTCIVSPSLAQVQPNRPATSNADKSPILRSPRLYMQLNAEYRPTHMAGASAPYLHGKKIESFRGATSK